MLTQKQEKVIFNDEHANMNQKKKKKTNICLVFERTQHLSIHHNDTARMWFLQERMFALSNRRLLFLVFRFSVRLNFSFFTFLPTLFIKWAISNGIWGTNVASFPDLFNSHNTHAHILALGIIFFGNRQNIFVEYTYYSNATMITSNKSYGNGCECSVSMNS